MKTDTNYLFSLFLPTLQNERKRSNSLHKKITDSRFRRDLIRKGCPHYRAGNKKVYFNRETLENFINDYDQTLLMQRTVTHLDSKQPESPPNIQSPTEIIRYLPAGQPPFNLERAAETPVYPVPDECSRAKMMKGYVVYTPQLYRR